MDLTDLVNSSKGPLWRDLMLEDHQEPTDYPSKLFITDKDLKLAKEVVVRIGKDNSIFMDSLQKEELHLMKEDMAAVSVDHRFFLTCTCSDRSTRIFGLKSGPEPGIRLTQDLLSETTRCFRPMTEFVTRLLAPRGSVDFSDVTYLTNGPRRETGGAIYHCNYNQHHEPDSRVNKRQSESKTERLVFWNRADPDTSDFSFIVAGEDPGYLAHLFEKYIGSISQWDSNDGIRMRVYYALIARMSWEGWTPYLNDFESKLAKVCGAII